MSDGTRKSRNRQEVLANEKRCIYCANAPSCIEHMPHRDMFIGKRRPSGMEFAACDDCNTRTGVADLVAAFFARLGQGYTTDATLITEAAQRRGKLAQLAPGFLDEFFRGQRQNTYLRDRLGILKRYVAFHANGPLTKAYLTVFAGKLGMALYREHIGEPLPLSGGVHTAWFLNAGLSQRTGDTMLSKMPIYSSLKQGSFFLPEQFGYRFNTDGKSILAALSGFHSNLHFFTVATSDQQFFKLPPINATADFVRPGELVNRIPQKIIKAKFPAPASS